MEFLFDIHRFHWEQDFLILFFRISAIRHHLKSQQTFISDSGSVNRIIVSNKENFVDFVFKISFYD